MSNPNTQQPTDAELLKMAGEEIEQLENTKEQQLEKIARFERKETAEKIALLLFDAGRIEADEVIPTRDKYASSDRDLDSLLTSMQEYGAESFEASPEASGETSPHAGRKLAAGIGDLEEATAESVSDMTAREGKREGLRKAAAEMRRLKLPVPDAISRM